MGSQRSQGRVGHAGGPVAERASEATRGQSAVDFAWKGRAADRYAMALGEQRNALAAVRDKLTAVVGPALGDVATALYTFFLSIIVAIGLLIVGIIAAIAAASSRRRCSRGATRRLRRRRRRHRLDRNRDQRAPGLGQVRGDDLRQPCRRELRLRREQLARRSHRMTRPVTRRQALRRGAIAMTIVHGALAALCLFAATDLADDSATVFRYFGAASVAAALAMVLVFSIASTTRRSTFIGPAGTLLVAAFVLRALGFAERASTTWLFLGLAISISDSWLLVEATRRRSTDPVMSAPPC